MWDSRSYTRRFSQAVQSGEYHQLNTLRVAVFTDTVEHIKREQYLNQRGKTVLLPLDWRLAKESVLYTKKIEDTPSLGLETLITVVNADCLAVAQEEQDNPLVLNMANPHTPGGGVEGGAGAQEEHLFRSSNYLLSLYSFDDTLAKAYGIPRAKKSYPLCDAYGAVYSPKVTVFRGREKDGYPLLDQPYKASFIALPAIYGPPLIKNKKGLYEMEEPDRLLTKEKIRTLLKVAKNHNHQTLILSAMGCGAFCNPPNQVASLFREVLQESPYRGSFAKIIFAITDDHNTHKWYNPEGNYAPFAREFKNGLL
ncbi:MAG TPA: TIGR02452 family protein [Sphaerochaeta sp.]|nr:TIGR02452 family protein [Sphaerochaeta sp.]